MPEAPETCWFSDAVRQAQTERAGRDFIAFLHEHHAWEDYAREHGLSADELAAAKRWLYAPPPPPLYRRLGTWLVGVVSTFWTIALLAPIIPISLDWNLVLGAVMVLVTVAMLIDRLPHQAGDA